MNHVLVYDHPVFNIEIDVEVTLPELKRRLRGLDKLDVKSVHIVFNEGFGGGWYSGKPQGAFDGIAKRENRYGSTNQGVSSHDRG